MGVGEYCFGVRGSEANILCQKLFWILTHTRTTVTMHSLAVGTLCGLLDLYDACIRRYTYKKIFELTYVSPSQVLIRKKSEKHSNMIKSKVSRQICVV